MDRIPKAGEPVTAEDFDMILEAVGQRQQNFPQEPSSLTMAMIFFNIGDRFTPVTCIEEEWTGVKQDLRHETGIPKCPNGHTLTEGPSLKLGWVNEQ